MTFNKPLEDDWPGHISKGKAVFCAAFIWACYIALGIAQYLPPN